MFSRYIYYAYHLNLAFSIPTEISSIGISLFDYKLKKIFWWWHYEKSRDHQSNYISSWGVMNGLTMSCRCQGINHKCQPQGSTLKLRGSPQSVGFILWTLWSSVPNFMASCFGIFCLEKSHVLPDQTIYISIRLKT